MYKLCYLYSVINTSKFFHNLLMWALTFWRKMAEVTEKQATWKRSVRWLDTEEAKIKRKDAMSNELQLARKELSILGWDVGLDYQWGAVSSSVLSALLSTVWLSDEHINMMMEELRMRLALDPDLSLKVIIVSLAFQIQINNNAKVKTYTKNNSPLLHRYHKRIEEGLEKIYFPINVNGDHWIAGVVDLQTRSVGYGMNHFPQPVKTILMTQNIKEICYYHHMDPPASSCVTSNGGFVTGLD